MPEKCMLKFTYNLYILVSIKNFLFFEANIDLDFTSVNIYLLGQ